MITAVDTNVLIDVLSGTTEQLADASGAIQKLGLQGELVIPAICYAELAGRFSDRAKLDDFVDLVGATVLLLDQDAAFLAGRFFRSYLQRGGPRERILADFLIAAQAQLGADRILTKDKRFYGMTFPKLKAVSPEDVITGRSSK
jgi:predicted nucleic acid-binding protein